MTVDPKPTDNPGAGLLPTPHSERTRSENTTMDEEKAPLQLEEPAKPQPFEETGRLLAEDIYSVFYTAERTSGAFACSLLGIFGQIFLLVLILLDITDFGGDLPLLIPPGVPLFVNIAQFIGVILTVWFLESNGDMMKGVDRFTEGYDPQILEVFPYATKAKWAAASVLQIGSGTLMLADLFILMMQSTTIIILCLNFAALHFVSDIPDVAFISGIRGVMVTRRVQEAYVAVAETKIPPIDPERQKKIHLIRRFCMIGSIILLYGGYFLLIAWQWNGRYMCTSLYVQFGDAFTPEMAYFSGRFEGQGSQPTKRIDTRTYFLDETKTIRLAYCRKEETWAFSLVENDHCDYFVKSIKTKTFDVTDLGGTSNWLSKHPDTNKDVPTDWLYLGCNECTSDTCEHGTCDASDHQCHCDEGFMGRNCEFALPSCTHLDIDIRSQTTLAKSTGGEFLLERGESGFKLQQSPKYGMLQLRYFPLYVSLELTEETHNFAVLAFIGRRWALFGRTGRDFFNSTAEYEALTALFEGRPYQDSILSYRDTWFAEVYRPYFFSEPVDLSTPSFSMVPIGLDWYQAVEDRNMELIGWYADEGQLTGAKLQCADCHPEDNPCQNGGVCDRSQGEGHCDCPFSFTGTLCEAVVTCKEIGGCMNNGTCNEYSFCECPYPFHGGLCQNYPTDFVPPFSCTREPCLNGGTCDVVPGTCRCPRNFSGDRCETAS